MSPENDDMNEMSGDQDIQQRAGRSDHTARLLPFDGMTAGDGMEGDELVTQFLAELRQFAETPAPVPSADLAALLGGATPIASRRVRHRAPSGRRRNALIFAAVGAAAISFTGAAAANDSLPGPAQNVVSSVVNGLTPFHIDSGDKHPTRSVVPTHGTSHSTEPGHEGSAQNSPEPDDSHASDPAGSEDNSSDAPGGGGSTERPDSGETRSSAPTSDGEHHDSGTHSSSTSPSEHDGSHSSPSSDPER